MVEGERTKEPVTSSDRLMPIVMMLIYLIRGDGGSCRLAFTVADNIQSEARHGESTKQPERIHITQNVDLAMHE